MGIRSEFSVWRVLLAGLILSSLALQLNAAEKAAEKAEAGDSNNALKAPAETSAEAQQALRSYLKLQELEEQLQQTKLAVEQTRKEAQASARESAELIAARLKVIEQTVSSQRDRDIADARNASKFALIVAAGLGSVGLLVMLLTAWFLMKTARQFSAVAALSGGPALSHMNPVGLLTDSSGTLRPALADESGVKLLGAIERLEKRVHQIERTGPPAAGNHVDDRAGNGKPGGESLSELAVLLGKGQSLLHLDQAEEAMSCFDKVLELDPDNTDALIKKGTALERLGRFEDAVECYDRAIAVDDSVTLAYLYKGGVFNQLERFAEALQCYEKALRTQQKVAVH